MGLFSDITSAIGSVFGNSSQPSSDPNDLKKKQNVPNAPTVNNNLTASKVNLPTPLLKASGPPKPVIPIAAPSVNTSNLTAQPVLHVATSPFVQNLIGGQVKQQAQAAPQVASQYAPGQSGNTFQPISTAKSIITAPIKSTEGLGNDIATRIVAPSIEKEATQSQQNTQKTLGTAFGNNPTGQAFASQVAAQNKQDILNQLLQEGGVNQKTSRGALVVKGLGEAAGTVTAPFAFGNPETLESLATGARGLAGGSLDEGGQALTTNALLRGTGKEVEDDIAPTATENLPPETGTKGPEEPTPTNAPTNEPGKPAPALGATESGVKPNPDAPAPVRPVGDNLNEPTQPTPAPITPPEVVPVQAPPVEQTPQAPVATPAPEVAAPPKAPAVAPEQAASEAVAASPEQQAVVDEAPNTDDLLNQFSKLRKQAGSDKDFYENTILNNQETPGPIGQLSRSIARNVEGHGADITQELDNQLAPLTKEDLAGTNGPDKEAQLNDLKQTARQLEKDTGQKGLYSNLAKNMANMTQDEQIAYLSKGLKDARDSGAMAAAHVGVKPAETAPSEPPTEPTKALPADTANVKFEQTENPLKGEEPKSQEAAPLGVEKLPVTKEADVTQQIKPEKGIVKAESLETRASKQGAPGRELVQRATNDRIETSQYLTKMRDMVKSYYDLNKADQKEATFIHEGKLQPTENTSPEVLQAVQDLKTLMPKVHQEVTQAGVDSPDLGPNYFPHIFEKGYLDKNFAKSAQHLVDTGQARNTEEATKLLNSNRDYMGGKASANLVKERTVNLPGYKTDSEALDTYLQGAAKTIADAHQFGPNNEEIVKLIERANTHGQDGKALADIFNKYWNPDTGTTGGLGKTANVALKTQNLLQLQKSFIAHLPQGLVNIGSKYGISNYGKGLIDQMFSSEDRAYIHDAGVDAENAHDTSGTNIKNPFNRALQFVRRLNRGTAFVTGKNIAENLADKGDDVKLRSLGITGDLEKGADGKINLTDAQKYQASHYVADKTIFTNDPIQSSSFVQGNAGKFFGQYRGQYVFKQAGFINNLVKEATHGNPLPALRYLGLATAGGVVVTGLKQLFEGKNPITQAKTNLKSDIEQVASNSGAESAGAGGVEDVTNEAEYHSPNETAQNVAGAVSPSAGNVVETGQNVDNVLRGNKNPLIKQVSSYAPGGNALLNSRVGKIAGYVPPKTLTPAEQKFDNAWDANYNKVLKTLSPSFSKSANPTAVKADEKTRDIFTSMVASDHDPSTGATILKTPDQTKSQAANAVAYPKALQAYQKLEQSLPNHNPVYDLPTTAAPGQPSLTTYETYETYTKGDPNRTVLEQQNPWLINEFNKEQTFFNAQGKLSNTVEPKGYIPYPPITSAQSDMMTQLTNLSSIQNRTPAQETELNNLENNPDVQKAYTLLDNYTNANRKAESAAPIPYPTENLTPAMNALLAQEEALPSDTGAKTAFINANLPLWNQAQQILAETTEYAANEYGAVVDQGGKEPNLLKDQYELGQNDIAATKNADGTTTYSLNPAQAYANSSSSGTSASGAAYDRDKAAGLSDLDTTYSTKAKVTGLKADTKKYVAPKLIADTAPTGKNGNPFVQAITTTKGVKQRKGGDNIYAANISNSKGVKTA